MISTQPIFGGAVAAIGIGMVPLHQRLEPRLDLGRRGIDLEAKRVERLALGIAHDAALPPRAGLSRRAARAAESPEQAERIIGAAECEARRMRTSARLPPFMPIFQVGRWPVTASFW